MTLGNHEFDKGQQVLADFIKAASGTTTTLNGITMTGSNIPVINCNVLPDAGTPLAGLFGKSMVKDFGGTKVAIIGVTTPDTPSSSSPGPGVTFAAAQASVTAEIAAVKAANPGINKFVILSHLGYEEDIALAGAISDIDIVSAATPTRRCAPQAIPGR